MLKSNGFKFKSMVEFWDSLPRDEYEISDVLKQIIINNLPQGYKVRLSYNVPYYYLKRRVCFVWPGSIPRGGFQKGIMIGFCYGTLLDDKYRYLDRGTNTQVYYKIITDLDKIDANAISILLQEAIRVDNNF